MLGGASFWTALAFTLLFGVSNGLVTIMRGAVPLALFGPKGYGEMLGILATPYLLLAALAPAAFAMIVERWGYGVGEAIMLGAGLSLVPRHGGDGAVVSAPAQALKGRDAAPATRNSGPRDTWVPPSRNSGMRAR